MTVLGPDGVSIEARRAAALWLRNARGTLIEAFGALQGRRPAPEGGGVWPDDESAERHRTLICAAIVRLMGGPAEIEERFGINVSVEVVTDPPTEGTVQ